MFKMPLMSFGIDPAVVVAGAPVDIQVAHQLELRPGLLEILQLVDSGANIPLVR